MSKLEHDPDPKKHTSRGVKALGVFFALMILLFLLISGGGWIVNIIYNFFLGWLSFILNNLASIELNWELITCGTVALALGTYGLHRISHWIRKDKPWRWRWTLSIVSLTLFLFAASIAMTGIVHQTVWLMKSPLLESNRHGRTKAIAHQKQLLIGLTEYQIKHGKYPESLAMLKSLESYPDFPEVLLYDQTQTGWEPWLYFGSYYNSHPELESTHELPLTMSRVAHGGQYVLMMTDGSVITLSREGLLVEFPKLIDFLPHLFE